MLNSHFQRIADGLSNKYHLHNLSDWIEKHVYLESKRMSMSGAYSFQRDIVNDTSRVNNVVKLAQIGLTTATMSYMLAAMATQEKFNVIYALPSAGDANKLVTTKLVPMIHESPELKRLLNNNVDSVELKQLGGNFLFSRGTKSETAALSISADCLVADEIDRADEATLKQFRSRLQGSQLQIIRQFSTPTFSGVGISREAKTSKRYRHMATCFCCGHKWLPSYHTDVQVPGYKKDLIEVTSYTIKDIAWQKAHWVCPHCGKDPVLAPERLEWVCENPTEGYEANTYYVSPVTVCQILKPPYFVRSSSEFTKRSEFLNQVLGEVSTDSDDQITEEDVAKALVPADLMTSEMHFMGADMGQQCAVTIGRMTLAGHLVVCHREMVPLAIFEQRRGELIAEYKVVACVMDCQPETHLITRICDYDPRAYGAIFITSKSPELFTLTEKLENAEVGKLNLRLLKVNRTVLMDEILTHFKKGTVVIRKTEQTEKFSEQYLSLKKMQVLRNSEMVLDYVKSDGNDHMMFSLGYLSLAIKVGRGHGYTLPGAVSIVSSFNSVEF